MFWTQVATAYNQTVAHAFALTGQGVADYANGEEIDLVPWLQRTLVKGGLDLVLTYDLANGIGFPTWYVFKNPPEDAEINANVIVIRDDDGETSEYRVAEQQKKRLGDLLGLGGNIESLPPQLRKQAQQAAGGELELPRDPSQALPLLTRALDLTRQGYKVALILPYAQNLFPAAVGGASSPLDRLMLEFALTWASNPAWRGSDNAPLIFFISPSLTTVNSQLAELLYAVELEAPDYDDRLAFVENALAANDVALDGAMTPQRLASITAGLLKRHMMDIIVSARIAEQAVTAERAKQRKQEIMNTAYAGVLETEETTGSLDDVGALDYLIGYLRDDVIQPMKNGDAATAPMGVLLAGPPGTGKSYLASKVAAEAGVSFVNFKMSNILGGIVGQSEANLEKALAGIRSLTPCIVFVDEIDQAFRRSEGFDGNSVNRNVFGRLLNFMADTNNRGKVVWLAATNRPDLLDAAMMRSGRFDAIVAVLPPETATAREILFDLMARKTGTSLAGGVDVAADRTDGYTGADIERVVLKALSVARKAGHLAVQPDDLLHAVDAVRINTKDRDTMTAAALAVVNDLDLLPPAARERALAQDEQVQDVPPTTERKARNLNLEA
jgi:transitional endoplasmic reticulum ATPase